MTKLYDLFQAHNDRQCGKWKHYFPVYDRYFEPWIGKEFTLLEIGTGNGGCLQIWKKYFGDKVKIYGIDHDPKTVFEEPLIKTFCGKQADPDFLNKIIEEIGRPDIIIDDGSHLQMDVLQTFRMLWPILKDDGIYVVEDTHTAYWDGWQGGITTPFNFITIASRWAHDVNLQHIKEPYTPVFNDLKSMSFYDSMVFFEKEKMTLKVHEENGPNRVV
jgi:hypothetical protein